MSQRPGRLARNAQALDASQDERIEGNQRNHKDVGVSYVIETGVPIPPRAKPGPEMRGAKMKSPLSITLHRLALNESFLMEDHTEFLHSRGMFSKYMDRKFLTRKTRDGWRVWRIE